MSLPLHSSSERTQRDPLDIIRSWVDDAASDGDPDIYTGRRRWKRVRWQVPVTIEARPSGPRLACQFVTSRDVSEAGIGFWCSQELELGTPVRLAVDDGSEFVEGRVKQCTESIGGFIIGVQFAAAEPR